MTRPSHPIRGFITSLILCTTLLFCNALQIASILVKPIAPTLFRRINREIVNAWWGLCVIWAERLYGMKLIITGDPIPAQENAIVILNHQAMVDIPIMLAFGLRKGRLGDLKWFVKDVIKYVPGVGWGMLFINCLFIKRDWTADRDYIESVFAKIVDNRIPSWIVSFVEGTRLRPKKLALSQQHARERGLVPTHHVMIPRTKGFVATTQALRNHVTAVYDLTIGYLDGPPTLWQWVQGLVPEVHLHTRRFPIETLPTEEKALSDWLLQLFQEKDRLLENFYQNKRFSFLK